MLSPKVCVYEQCYMCTVLIIRYPVSVEGYSKIFIP